VFYFDTDHSDCLCVLLPTTRTLGACLLASVKSSVLNLVVGVCRFHTGYPEAGQAVCVSPEGFHKNQWPDCLSRVLRVPSLSGPWKVALVSNLDTDLRLRFLCVCFSFFVYGCCERPIPRGVIPNFYKQYSKF
jgi:hypothetical protein